MRGMIALGAAALFALALPLAAAAGNTDPAQQEAATAQAHALMAANANSLATTHAHLQHVVNCLVGPKGKGFDASAENPCKGMGNGALPDSESNAKMHGMLENALRMAETGLQSDKAQGAQQAAKKTADLLQQAPRKAG